METDKPKQAVEGACREMTTVELLAWRAKELRRAAAEMESLSDAIASRRGLTQQQESLMARIVGAGIREIVRY